MPDALVSQLDAMLAAALGLAAVGMAFGHWLGYRRGSRAATGAAYAAGSRDGATMALATAVFERAEAGDRSAVIGTYQLPEGDANG